MSTPEQFEALLPIAEVSRAAVVAALDVTKGGRPSPETSRLLMSLSVDALMTRRPRDWALAEQYAREAVAMAEKLDAPVDLAAALGALSDVLSLRGFWRERAQVAMRRMALSDGSRSGDTQERATALIDAGEALVTVGDYVQAIQYLVEGANLAAQVQAVELEKWALDQRIHSLLWLDRWDEVLSLDGKLRDMQRRYPREQIGPSCYAISAIARIHALRGELELAREQRNEADTIMTAITGPHENWSHVQHY